MNINMVVEKTGLTKRMIRHYEEVGLILPERGDNNYRQYQDTDVDNLLCIKALRNLGFPLEDIKQILKETNVESILETHLNELLFKQRELFLEQKSTIDLIKNLLRSKNHKVNTLLDQIASINAPSSQGDELKELLLRPKVIHGRIQELALLAEKVQFGVGREYEISETQFIKFGELFERLEGTGASICSCDELYTHFLLITKEESLYSQDFHRQVWAQFAQGWQTIAKVMALNFEAMTKNISGLENLYSPYDVAISITAKNPAGSELKFIIPYQQLHTFLGRTAGIYNR